MTRFILVFFLMSSAASFSQERTFEKEVKKISKKIEEITLQHKDSLKKKIEKINLRLINNEISADKAKELKKVEANYHAKQIEVNVSIQEYKLQQLVQNKVDGEIASEEDEDAFRISIFDQELFSLKTDKNKRKRKYGKRTTTQFVLAMGINNVLENNNFNSLNTSNYKFWQSHFYELGFTFKTRFKKEPSKTYFKYGLSFLWNNLRPRNNKYHVSTHKGLFLEEGSMQLEESRIRHVQMIFPVHLEFDFSENKVLSDNTTIDNTNDGVRLGFGGFFGFKLGTRQYLEYRNDQDVFIEVVEKGDFNMNIVTYGLSSYMAYEGIGLYVKYDLNPLFKNMSKRNISLGIRIDLN